MTSYSWLYVYVLIPAVVAICFFLRKSIVEIVKSCCKKDKEYIIVMDSSRMHNDTPRPKTIYGNHTNRSNYNQNHQYVQTLL